jgi:hypothetical protein
MQLLEDRKDVCNYWKTVRKIYWNFTEGALDHTPNSTGFGRDYGPVVRQATHYISFRLCRTSIVLGLISVTVEVELAKLCGINPVTWSV